MENLMAAPSEELTVYRRVDRRADELAVLTAVYLVVLKVEW